MGATLRGRSLAAHALILLTGCALMSGCKTTTPNLTEGGDPLVGELDGPGAPPPAPTGSPSAKLAERNEPLPLRDSMDDPKSLAALTSADREDNPRMRIDTPIGNPGRAKLSPPPKGEWHSAEEQEKPPTDVIMKSPQPVEKPPRGGGLALTGGISSQIISVEQGLAQLRGRQAKYRLEPTGDGGARLICIIPNPEEPSIYRRYEFEAENEIGALRGILEQIAEEEREIEG